MRTRTKRINMTKVLLAFMLVLSIFYLYPNVLLLTNKVHLYINKQFLLKEIRSYGLIEADFLKSHINSTLPIVKALGNEEDDEVNNIHMFRWLAGEITGFDIKNLRTVLSAQLILMKGYDTKIISALGTVSESVSASANEEKILIVNDNNGDLDNEDKENHINELDDKAEELDQNGSITETNINPSDSKGYEQAKGIYIKNETKYKVDINALLNESLNMKFAEKGPQVLIVHTHTSEAYTRTNKNNYKPSDPDRTEDPRYNIVRVGEEIAKHLENKGISVIHDKTIHDYPSYNGSYLKCLETIQSNLKKYPSIRIVLDIHRDGLIFEDGTKLKVTAEINNTKVSQVMLVVGTNEGGLEHPNWKENLKFAIRIQNKMNQLYPKFARPINLRRERFNQHATTGSLIVEVGSNGNTLEESVAAAQYFANALSEVIKEIK